MRWWTSLLLIACADADPIPDDVILWAQVAGPGAACSEEVKIRLETSDFVDYDPDACVDDTHVADWVLSDDGTCWRIPCAFGGLNHPFFRRDPEDPPIELDTDACNTPC